MLAITRNSLSISSGKRSDMVFVDGKFLQSAGWEGEIDENSYFINYDTKEVYIGVNPNDIIGVAYDRLSGQAAFFNTRVRVYKA